MSQVNQSEAQETTSEPTQESQARAIVYNFLSSLFAKEVTSDLVTQLTSAPGQNFLNSLALEPSLSASVNEVNNYLAKVNSKESLLELAADFCGLFLVDGRTSVSPYAGQYLSAGRDSVQGVKRKSEKTQIFGESHQKMSEFLTLSNMQVHSDFPEPSDHIAVILAYIAHLCLSTNADDQLEFIETYLMTWINEFTQQVNKHDQGRFYSAVANLTLKWLKMEIEDLKNSE
jgi:TorA-specific chaperone